MNQQEVEMEKIKRLLAELYYQLVDNVPPEVGSRGLWDTVREVEYALGLSQTRTNF